MDKGYKASEEKNHFEARAYPKSTGRAGVLHSKQYSESSNFVDFKVETWHKAVPSKADPLFKL